MTEEHSAASSYPAATPLLTEDLGPKQSCQIHMDQVADEAWYQGQHVAAALLEYRQVDLNNSK